METEVQQIIDADNISSEDLERCRRLAEQLLEAAAERIFGPSEN
jgi:hypothetical protein